MTKANLHRIASLEAECKNLTAERDRAVQARERAKSRIAGLQEVLEKCRRLLTSRPDHSGNDGADWGRRADAAAAQALSTLVDAHEPSLDVETQRVLTLAAWVLNVQAQAKYSPEVWIDNVNEAFLIVSNHIALHGDRDSPLVSSVQGTLPTAPLREMDVETRMVLEEAAQSLEKLSEWRNPFARDAASIRAHLARYADKKTAG